MQVNSKTDYIKTLIKMNKTQTISYNKFNVRETLTQISFQMIVKIRTQRRWKFKWKIIKKWNLC